jgi:hypothetical protein
MIKKFYELIKTEYGEEFKVEEITYMVNGRVTEKNSVVPICPDFLISKGIISFEILNELFDVKDFESFYIDSVRYHLAGVNIVDEWGRLVSVTWLINRAEKGGISYEQ